MTRVIVAVSLLLLTGLLIAFAVLLPDFVFSFYPVFSRRVIGLLARISSLAPFALWEWIALGLVLWLLYSLTRSIIKRRLLRWLSGVLLGVSIGVFLFVGLWGLNHFGPSLGERLDLEVQPSTEAELKQAAAFYLSRANALAAEVPRGEDGLFRPGDFKTLGAHAGDGYKVLAKENDLFDGSTVPVKRLASSKLFAKMAITGIFVDLTGESCVSDQTYFASLPFTMCHEVGHRMGLAAEDEANFAAFLACDASDDLSFRYSGYFEAFCYCYSALFDVNPSAAYAVFDGANDYVRSDYHGAAVHYEQVVSEVASNVSDTVNNAYLKAFSESSGTKSYGEVTDLLIAWYKENAGTWYKENAGR
ncbi:MAG: DUF3810 domain-containing protein [Clostridia bacterium]|nr:DUF3810 domain-containing protein [Clostridia bacterium]